MVRGDVKELYEALFFHRLDQWMKGTKDLLIQGDLPAPEGALINNPDGLSPDE